ncbi:MAG TPA: condensation domain-containing protein [Pyrinomonadaceae bacterium]|jgi:hypothetical protein
MSGFENRIADLPPEKLARLVERLKPAGEASTLPPVVPRQSKSNCFPLSYAQQRLWFMHQLEPEASVYNIPATPCLSGPLDRQALERSLTEIVRRHETLRTTFSIIDGQPMQVIATAQPFLLPVTDLSSMPEQERELEAGRMANEEAQRPFKLEQGPLLRARLLRLGENEHVLLLTMHHIISDGWSIGIFFRELTVIYNAYLRGQASPLPELSMQYADYTVWQRQWLQGEVLGQHLAYWKQHLAGAPATLELPIDRPRPAERSYQGAAQYITLSASTSDALRELCRQEGVTMFMLLLAAFQTLLVRCSGQEDICVGTPIAGRNHSHTEALIGFFLNTLVMRTNLSGNPSFREALRRVREVCLGAYAHQDMPFERLVAELQPERTLGHSPLFQVWFVLQNTPKGFLKLDGINFKRLGLDAETAIFDLIMVMVEAGKRIGGCMVYDTELFDAETVAEILRHFKTLLEEVAADPARGILEIPLDSEEAESDTANLSDTWQNPDAAEEEFVFESTGIHAETIKLDEG